MYWYEDEEQDQTQASRMRVWVEMSHVDNDLMTWVGCCTHPILFVYDYKSDDYDEDEDYNDWDGEKIFNSVIW